MLQMIQLAFCTYGEEAPVLINAAKLAAATILLKRPDVKPWELTQMFVSIGGSAHYSGDALIGILFSSDVLTERADVKPEEMGKLFSTIAAGTGALSTGEAFLAAATTLEKRPDLKPGDLSDLFMSMRFAVHDPNQFWNSFVMANQLLQEGKNLMPEDALKKIHDKNHDPVAQDPQFFTQNGYHAQNSRNAEEPAQSMSFFYSH